MKRRFSLLTITLFLIVHICIPVIAFSPPEVGLVYRINQENAKIWINKDGTMDLLYNIVVSCSEESIGVLTVGMPNPFHIVFLEDDIGSLQHVDVSTGDFYGVDVFLRERIGPLYPQQSVNFSLQARVERMIWEDETTQGNVGLEFYPALWDTPPAPIDDLRVAVVLPEGVEFDEIKTTEIFYDGIATENGHWVVYWERENYPPAEKLELGVSFPKEYVDKYHTVGEGNWIFPLALGLIIAIVIGIILMVRRIRREGYEKPKIMIEALGPRRGLTAVEAAVVTNSKPAKVLTMILFGLLLKKQVLVETVEPLLKISKVDKEGERDEVRRRYYEIDFLQTIELDGSLNERRLARTYLSLSSNVDRKMRGYSRADTVNYYQSIVENAWQQVKQSGTPQLRGEAIEENLQWLLVDKDFDNKFRTAFPPDFVIIPNPGWFWYWRGPSSPTNLIDPSQTPTGTPGEIKPIPAQEFADRIVSGLERTSSNLVKDVERFANKLLPSKTSQTRDPVRRGRACVCACANCACACACVSCACACAGGGAR